MLSQSGVPQRTALITRSRKRHEGDSVGVRGVALPTPGLQTSVFRSVREEVSVAVKPGAPGTLFQFPRASYPWGSLLKEYQVVFTPHLPNLSQEST